MISITSGGTYADTGQSTEDAFRQASEAISADPAISSETKQALQGLLTAIQQENTSSARRVSEARDISTAIEQYMANHPGFGNGLDANNLLARVKIKGDLRLRQENNARLDSKASRARQRTRFRVGATLPLNDEFTLGARLITGNRDDPNSPHHDFGQVFDSLEISLDRAYITYSPKSHPGTSITAGKFGHPFVTNPVFGELVWDGDVQGEGAVVVYKHNGEVGKITGIRAVGGIYNLIENSSGKDAVVVVGQVSGKLQINEAAKLSGAVGYYHYTDVTPDGSSKAFLDNNSNAVAGGEFLSQFGILNPIVAVEINGLGWPVVFSGEYLYNTRAQTDQDSGWAAGVAVGKAKKKGTSQVYYQYQIVEQDAVFSPVVQDDFLLASNFHGHVFGIKHKVQDWMTLHVWSLVSARDQLGVTSSTDSDHDQWRVRADLNINF